MRVMLSKTLKVFFATYENFYGLNCERTCGEKIFKNGFIKGYRKCFAHYGVDWTGCPADFKVLEQVVLARNSSQHAGSITSTHANHCAATMRKHPSPLFISDYGKDLMQRHGGSWMTLPTVHVTREALDAAINEVEKLAQWFDPDVQPGTNN